MVIRQRRKNMSKTECELFRDRSVYPQEESMIPAVVSVDKLVVAPTMRSLEELLSPAIPLTKQELSRPFGPFSGSALNHIDLPDFPNIWKQVGVHWVRQQEGRYAQCHTRDRLGAYVLWRDADRSYCCDGLPTYYHSALVEMQKTMEVFKPVLSINVKGGPVIDISLARSIAYPHGCCWGLSTFADWTEVAIDGCETKEKLTSISKVREKLNEIRKTI